MQDCRTWRSSTAGSRISASRSTSGFLPQPATICQPYQGENTKLPQNASKFNLHFIQNDSRRLDCHRNQETKSQKKTEIGNLKIAHFRWASRLHPGRMIVCSRELWKYSVVNEHFLQILHCVLSIRYNTVFY